MTTGAAGAAGATGVAAFGATVAAAAAAVDFVFGTDGAGRCGGSTIEAVRECAAGGSGPGGLGASSTERHFRRDIPTVLLLPIGGMQGVTPCDLAPPVI